MRSSQDMLQSSDVEDDVPMVEDELEDADNESGAI